jgi:hypothetical protein
MLYIYICIYRLRIDHIVMAGDDTSSISVHGQPVGRDTSSSQPAYMSLPCPSSSSSSSRAEGADKMREREQEALLNPNNAMLTNSLKKKLLRERATISAVFRKADSLLGRHEPSLIRERKVQTSSGIAVDTKTSKISNSVSVTVNTIISDRSTSLMTSKNNFCQSSNNTFGDSKHIPNNVSLAPPPYIPSQCHDVTRSSNTASHPSALPQGYSFEEQPPKVDMRYFLRIFRDQGVRNDSDRVNDSDIELRSL